MVEFVEFAVVYLGSYLLLCLVEFEFGYVNRGWFVFRCLLFASSIGLVVFVAACLWAILRVFVYVALWVFAVYIFAIVVCLGFGY